jgi:4-amino-4-deoxy-L-arabinose transferase-like glycosyltransferase
MEKIKTWLKNNWLLVLILVVGAFLRLYRIGDYMTFLGDEGRDAIIVRRLLVYGDPILIGPGTSIGSMYLGPLYYYLIAPSLFLANYSPAGPSVFIALIGVATIYFVYHVGREWFNEKSGIIAASLYAVSPVVIIYSRSSWNPNIMPFFALLCVYSIWRVWKYRQYKWLMVLGISFAFVLQSHYLGLLLAPTLFIFWLLRRPPLKYTLYGVAIFIFLMSPLVIFDARHGWNNFASMKKFFAERQSTVSARPWNAIPKMYPILTDINTSLLTPKNKTIGNIATIGIVLTLAWLALYKRKEIINPKSLLLFSWIVFGLLGLGLYKQQVYDHYYGFMFPAVFLLIGYLMSQLTGKSKIFYLLPIGLLFLCLWATPIKSPPNMQMKRAVEVSKKISEETKGIPFNIAVIAERNYEDGYQYFLEKDNLPVVDIDAQRPETIKDQLFVICEAPKDICDPTHSPKAEVANFGWSKVGAEWEVFGIRIYRLVHTQ